MPNREIHVSAVVFRDAEGRVLTVRKKGTDMFMFPGGKPESGENALEAALREVSEEIDVQLDAEELTLLGVFEAPAANEDGFAVVASVFTCAKAVWPRASAEIAELAWVFLHERNDNLAPLLADAVFPALEAN